MVHFIKRIFYSPPHKLKQNRTSPVASKMNMQPSPVLGAGAAPEWALLCSNIPTPRWDLYLGSLGLIVELGFPP